MSDLEYPDGSVIADVRLSEVCAAVSEYCWGNEFRRSIWAHAPWPAFRVWDNSSHRRMLVYYECLLTLISPGHTESLEGGVYKIAIVSAQNVVPFNSEDKRLSKEVFIYSSVDGLLEGLCANANLVSLS